MEQGGRFLIVTVPVLDGIHVQEYLGPVVVRTVRAVNVVRDFFTSFRDIFGGRSGSYQGVADNMYRDLMVDLRQSAERMGANAIIGFRVDFESVGAKRKSLVMAVAQGTAVRI
jgi:uncharacterized protein YbjQ (UPF0145 family)